MKKEDAKLRLIMFATAIIFAIALVIMNIVAFIKYADTPITEVPLWAYMFLVRK